MDENELVRGFAGARRQHLEDPKVLWTEEEIWGKVALETDFRLIKELAFCSKR